MVDAGVNIVLQTFAFPHMGQSEHETRRNSFTAAAVTTISHALGPGFDGRILV
jgi:hypothetical protein